MQWKGLMCVCLAGVLLAGCRPDANKNAYELLPFDVKEQESSLSELEERLSSDYQHILSSGTTNPQNNNTMAAGDSANLGTAQGAWSVRGGVGYPYSMGNHAIKITDMFGTRSGQHFGLDLTLTNSLEDATKVQNPDVLSVTDGVVHYVGSSDSAGNWLIVESYRTDGQRFYVIYMHMRDRALVNVGDSVSRGQKVGVEGNTGESFGAHVHMEVCISNNGNPESKSGRNQRLDPLVVLYGYDVKHNSTAAVKKELVKRSSGKMYISGYKE